jgi:hypothetical protein
MFFGLALLLVSCRQFFYHQPKPLNSNFISTYLWVYNEFGIWNNFGSSEARSLVELWLSFKDYTEH